MHSVRDGGTVLSVSQGDIALAAGASRQRVNAELRRLAALGHLSLQYRRIVVHEPPLPPRSIAP